jgi:hypothetical protein
MLGSGLLRPLVSSNIIKLIEKFCIPLSDLKFSVFSLYLKLNNPPPVTVARGLVAKDTAVAA